MAEIVNLARAKKQRAKAAAEATAAANRAKHGRTKAEKAADHAERERRARLLDQAKREGSAE